MRFFTFLLVLTSACQAYAQSVHSYLDSAAHFELQYPDSVKPVVLHKNGDIKGMTDAFVLQVLEEKATGQEVEGIPVYIELDSVSDDCYQFVSRLTTGNGTVFKRYTCSEGAAGQTYYNYIFQLKKGHWDILLKFLNSSCNACTDEQGNPLVYDEKKSMKWILDIVNSVRVKPLPRR